MARIAEVSNHLVYLKGRPVIDVKKKGDQEKETHVLLTTPV